MANRFAITVEAQADLDDIWIYTAETWSVDQAEAYDIALHETFDRIAEFPSIGKKISDLEGDIHAVNHASHFVFYDTDPIRILRVMHHRQDWQALLSQ